MVPWWAQEKLHRKSDPEGFPLLSVKLQGWICDENVIGHHELVGPCSSFMFSPVSVGQILCSGLSVFLLRDRIRRKQSRLKLKDINVDLLTYTLKEENKN